MSGSLGPALAREARTRAQVAATAWVGQERAAGPPAATVAAPGFWARRFAQVQELLAKGVDTNLTMM